MTTTQLTDDLIRLRVTYRYEGVQLPRERLVAIDPADTGAGVYDPAEGWRAGGIDNMIRLIVAVADSGRRADSARVVILKIANA